MQAVLRNTNLDPISVEQLRKYSPAVFAREPHEDVSERYGFIGTYQILEGMHKAGLVPVECRNYFRRDTGAMQHTKHMLRFRPSGKLNTVTKVGDIVPQIVLLNSHDRSSRFELYGGLYRLVCSNGMLCAVGTAVVPVVVRHTRHAIEDVIAKSLELIKNSKGVFEYVGAMQKTVLTERNALGFAKAALALRPERAGLIEPAKLLVPRRPADEGRDLWRVMNVVQENLTKGGIVGTTSNGRSVRTAEIRGINGDMKLNGGIWELAASAIEKARNSSKRAAVPA